MKRKRKLLHQKGPHVYDLQIISNHHLISIPFFLILFSLILIGILFLLLFIFTILNLRLSLLFLSRLFTFDFLLIRRVLAFPCKGLLSSLFFFQSPFLGLNQLLTLFFFTLSLCLSLFSLFGWLIFFLDGVKHLLLLISFL